MEQGSQGLSLVPESVLNRMGLAFRMVNWDGLKGCQGRRTRLTVKALEGYGSKGERNQR